MPSNSIYWKLEQILVNNISDIHILEDDFIYVRNSSWKIKKLDWYILYQEEIYWFLHDILPTNSVDLLLDGHEVDASHTFSWSRFRINAYKDNNWIRIALRKISSMPPSMEEIWFSTEFKNQLINKEKWLILVTWPTWSWKSTTLASIIEAINNELNSHIITLEDPIEFLYESKNSLITQREIWKDTKSWKWAIKYSLRQDPDVVLVWEMRDLDTISSVMTLVETWHLVLSSLHTTDAIQTINRIVDSFPANQQQQVAAQLSFSLDTIISQRLFTNKTNNWRVPVREVLINNNAVANNIRERKLAQLIWIMETSTKYWMRTMDQSLAEAVASGQIDLNVALSKVKNIDNFKSLVSYHKNGSSKFRPID